MSLRRLAFHQLVSVVLVILGFVFFGLQLNSVEPVVFAPPPLKLVVAAPLPVWNNPNLDRNELAAQLSSHSIYVMDVPSGSVLLEKNSREVTYPASTTKLMTALVVREVYDLDQVLTVKQEAFTQGTTMELQLGEEITVRNLLYGLLVSSGNDAAFVLANNYPHGGYAGFVVAMNQKAQQLHLDQTTFTNPSGLDVNEHQSSARDLVLLAKDVMNDVVLREMVGTQRLTITDTKASISHVLLTSNHLLGKVPGVIGVKTGTTPLAGEVLITDVQREGREVLIAVMGSTDRETDTLTLIDWIWQNYEWRDIMEGE